MASDEGEQLTDWELGRIAFRAVNFSDHWADLPDDRKVDYIAIARELRDALCPPVAPLRPGETVTIRDAWVPADSIAIASDVMRREKEVLSFWVTNVMEDGDEEIGIVYLDAAGVAQLIATCRRWQAVQGEGE